jgi:hypothetical protein
VFSAFRDKLRFWRSEFDGHYSTLQGRVQGKPAVLAGELLGGLRSQLITTPEVSYRAGISNAGLVKTSDGYLAIAKNNTYCFCQELGVDSDFGPNDKPARARLLLVELDDALRVTRVRRLALEVDGREYDDEADLREDARLSVFGSEIWCSVNLVPQGNQWRAEPVLGRLDLGSARLIAKTMRRPELRAPQKNWIPFAVGGALYLEYSINPHVVWRIDPSSLAVLEEHVTRFVSGYFGPRGPFYRGSAPLVRHDGACLGAAHSMVKVDGKRDYRTHFFLTDPHPPFKIRWFGRPVKLLSPARIQYVSAIVPSAGDDFVVSYGLADCDNLFARFNIGSIRATLRRL